MIFPIAITSPPALILDTSYLMEMFRVPNNHDPDFAKRAMERFKAAVDAGSLFFVPFSVLFEWANHIAHIPDYNSRRDQANKLHQAVGASLQGKESPPWEIWGADANALERFAERLHKWTEAYAINYVGQKIGLTDTTVIHAALDIKEQFPTRKVHIWTRDAKRKKDGNQCPLKEHEPDTEPDPLID